MGLLGLVCVGGEVGVVGVLLGVWSWEERRGGWSREGGRVSVSGEYEASCDLRDR